jgi:hypothetical protein
MRVRIQQIVDGLIDAVETDGHLDVIADLAYPLPTTVIADLLGLPAEDRALFKRWSDDIAAGFFLVVTRETADAVRRANESQTALAAYFRELVAARRAHPRDDLLSALVAAESDGAVLSEDELLATCVLLLFAGHETTTNLIGNGCLALLEHPAELERLLREPALLGSAVEEFLRYDGPVQATARRATVASMYTALESGLASTCSWFWVRPIATLLNFPTRTHWTSVGPTTGIWPSALDPTSAWARLLPGWRCRSPSRRCFGDYRGCDPAPRHPYAGRTSSCAASSRCRSRSARKAAATHIEVHPWPQIAAPPNRQTYRTSLIAKALAGQPWNMHLMTHR